MTDFMTTEELVLLLKKQKMSEIGENRQLESAGKTKKKKFKFNKKTIFWIITGLASLHILFITIPLVLPNRGINLLGYANLIAIPNTQELDEELYQRVITVHPFDINDIEVGDKVIVYGRFSTEVYWVETIVDIRENLGEIDTSFDGFIRNTNQIENIDYKFVRESSFIGVIYFTSSNLRGYLVMFSTHVLILGLVHYFFINEKDKKSKPSR
ncbi:MAG: hypothetical protein CVV57_00120 [Tenericutes bacterium HGW-Tenericutes-2]|nr:MAG: hypothetical protein CVV57_00120 [Tenericutes bacterium HGW-Tenericutes-2]